MHFPPVGTQVRHARLPQVVPPVKDRGLDPLPDPFQSVMIVARLESRRLPNERGLDFICDGSCPRPLGLDLPGRGFLQGLHLVVGPRPLAALDP